MKLPPRLRASTAGLLMLAAWLCLWSPAWAQGDPPRVVLNSGSLSFPAVTLAGDPITNSATSTFTLRCTDGVKAIGWNLTLQSSNIINGTSVLSPASLSFTPSGGTITRISGQAIDPTNGPLEAGAAGGGTLDTARKVVYTQSGFGKGSYLYTPLASNFVLTLPATALAGTYTATITATITTGP